MYAKENYRAKYAFYYMTKPKLKLGLRSVWVHYKHRVLYIACIIKPQTPAFNAAFIKNILVA